MDEMTEAEWRQARDALGQAVTRVVALLRSVTTPESPAVGSWTVAEVAMHLSQAWLAVPGMADEDLSAFFELLPSRRGATGASLLNDVWELGDTTVQAVQADTERDLAVLAERIESRARAFLATAAEHSADERRGWLVEGSVVTLPVLTCHLLNETLVHGYDMAKASGRPWPIEATHAAVVIAGFIVPVVRAMDPAAVVAPGRGARAEATFDLRIRGGRRFHFVFSGGQLHIEDPSPRRVDCHVTADPVSLLLVIWGRRSQWSAIAWGQLVAWGRKPWLGPQLRWFIRNP